MMNTRNLSLLLVLLTIALGACGTFELESDVLTEAQLATSTSVNSSASPTSPAEPVADVRITGVTVTLDETVNQYLHVSATGELTNNCFAISGWSQSVVGNRIVAQPIVAPAGETECDGASRAFAEQIVMDQHGFSLEQLVGSNLMLDVAGVVQPLQPMLASLLSTPPPTPALTTVPTPESQIITTEAFEQMLQEAITTHNYEWMTQLMDEPFDFALWQSQGYSVPAVEAANDLRVTYLPPGQEIVFGAPPPDLTPVLGAGKDILDIWNPAANAVGALFTTGWGPDGASEAFLIISVLDNGAVQWDGIIFAQGELGGFDGE